MLPARWCNRDTVGAEFVGNQRTLPRRRGGERRLARRQAGPPGEPSRGRPRPEARRHQGGDASALAGGDELLETIDTGALAGLRDRALLSAAAPREGREAARRAGPPPGGRGPRRLPREAAGLEEPKVALFQTVDPAGRRLTGRALDRRLVLAI